MKLKLHVPLGTTAIMHSCQRCHGCFIPVSRTSHSRPPSLRSGERGGFYKAASHKGSYVHAICDEAILDSGLTVFWGG